MNQESSIDDLVAQLRAGDNDAARKIFDEYAKRLIGLAQTRLSGPVRRRVDAEDVVQSVFKSFFVRLTKGEFDLESKDNIWSLLVVITLRKCGHKIRDMFRQRKDVRREIDPQKEADDSISSWQALAPGPTPAQAVMLTEIIERILAELKPRERQIVELHLQGCDITDIQSQVQRSAYTIRDVLKRVRRSLEAECDMTEA
jgi:RNA polymerase sigma-70 factor (ECF subfamily)